MGLADSPGSMNIELVYCPQPGKLVQARMSLPLGSLVQDALSQSGVLTAHPELAQAPLALGIWGAHCRATDALREGDRVEIYRPLQVDPKEARRQRYSSHRAKAKPKPGR